MADRSVLITGGTGGLGKAVTAAFAETGWRVVLPTRGTEKIPVDGTEVLTGVDLTDEGAVAEVTAVAAKDPAAPLTAVVNLVGGFAAGAKVHELSLEDFEGQFSVNLRPTFLVTRAALPHLVRAGGGSIVCVSSRAAEQPFPGASGYVTSKAAVTAFARAVAVEYRDAGVRCNVVVPSVIDTPGNRGAMPDADHDRWVQPGQIASTILFLAGTGSVATSGATIPVYGRA